MATTHWTWESKQFDVPWRDAAVTIGQINQIKNFCIETQGNENICISCHTGYGWEQNREAALSNPENADCLVCHADTGVYDKDLFGNPTEGIDLLAAAQSVWLLTKENCGKCQLDGGCSYIPCLYPKEI